jgi:hypothetical protein
VLIPILYLKGISTGDFEEALAALVGKDGEYRMRSPSPASRSRTRGWRTAIGPMPVIISRSGGSL